MTTERTDEPVPSSEGSATESPPTSSARRFIAPIAVLLCGLTLMKWGVQLGSSALFMVAASVVLVGIVWLAAQNANSFFED